jgi:hypothetical protein
MSLYCGLSGRKPPTPVDQAQPHLYMGSGAVLAPAQAILPRRVTGENIIIYLVNVIDICVI